METASSPDWDVAKLKLQPQSIEAERSVLGALLISADSWDGVAEVVSAADFYRHRRDLCQCLLPVHVHSQRGHLWPVLWAELS